MIVSRRWCRHSWLWSLAVLALTACGEALQPEELHGEYELIRFADRVPPAVVSANEDCSMRIDAGRLLLRADGFLEIALDQFFDCSASGGPAYALGVGYYASYTLDGHTLRITLHGDVSVPTTGQVRDQYISIVVGGPSSPLVFGR